MTPETRKNVVRTMRGEAFAYMKYMLFADSARQNGREDLALLFETTAQAKRTDHFDDFATLTELVGDDVANLRNAVRNETHEAANVYRQFAEQAAAAGDDDIAARFVEIGRDEAKHRDAFKAALTSIKAEV